MDKLPKTLASRRTYSGNLQEEFNKHHVPAPVTLFRNACGDEPPKNRVGTIIMDGHNYPRLERREQESWDVIGNFIQHSFIDLTGHIDGFESFSIETDKLRIPFEGVKGFSAQLELDFGLKVNGRTMLVMGLGSDEALLPLAAAHPEFLKVPEVYKESLGPIDAVESAYANCRYRYHYSSAQDDQEAKTRALRDVARVNKDAVAHALRLSAQAIPQAVAAGAPLVGFATAEFVMICPISEEQDFSGWPPDGYCTTRESRADKFYDTRYIMWRLNLDGPLILPVYRLPGVGTVVASFVVIACMQNPELREKLKSFVPDYDAEFDNVKRFELFKDDEEPGEERGSKKGKTGGGQPRENKAGQPLETSLAGVFADERFAAAHLAKMHMMESDLKRDLQFLSEALREEGGKINVRSNLKLGNSVKLHHAASDGYLSTTIFYGKIEGESACQFAQSLLVSRAANLI